MIRCKLVYGWSTLFQRIASTTLRKMKAAIDFIWRHPCLTSDFQLLVDKGGKVYHIDLDRCLGGMREIPMGWFEKNCVSNLKEKLGDLGLDGTVLDRDDVPTESNEWFYRSGRVSHSKFKTLKSVCYNSYIYVIQCHTARLLNINYCPNNSNQVWKEN